MRTLAVVKVRLVPKQSGTGGKTWLGRISKRGDTYLRRLLVTGALTAFTLCRAVKALPWIGDEDAPQATDGHRP
jgi:transposase